MTIRTVIFALVFLFAFCPSQLRAQFLEVCSVPIPITGESRTALENRREDLVTKQIALVSKGEIFNKQCGNVRENTADYKRCIDEFSNLERKRAALNSLVKDHCLDIEARSFQISADVLFQKIFRQSLDDYAELQRKAAQKSWSNATRTGFFLAILKLARGQNTNARASLNIAKFEYPSDQLVDELDKLLVARMIAAYENSTDRQTPPEVAEQSLEDKNRAAHILTLRGSVLLGQGDFDAALALFTEAQYKASGLAGSQRALSKAIVWTKQLKAAAEERLRPGQRTETYRKLRAQAAAEQAWGLGQALALAGHKSDSVEYYREANDYFEGIGGSVAKVVAEQMRSVRNGALKPNMEIVKLMMAPMTRASALLDALEYGKGDWQKSLDYLEARRKLLPDNLILRDTQIYLQGITVGR